MDEAQGPRQTGFMSSFMSSARTAPRRPSAPWPRQCVFGFAYWMLFLLVLEPGNLIRASEMGADLGLGHELVRMLGAASIGALTTPALLLLVARFPLRGEQRLRNLLLHALGVGAFALGLIVISCVLAAWVFAGTWLPTLAELRWQLADNWSLLVYALVAQAAIAHLPGSRCKADDASGAPPAPARPLSHVMTKVRGRQTLVALSQVDWIETQGNYLALHAGDSVHLVRQTITAFEAQLDPRHFVRVHRRALVAVDRIQDLKPLTNGDAELRLRGGQAIRVSRRYRKQLERLR